MFATVIPPASPLFPMAERLEYEIFGELNDWVSDDDRRAGRMLVYDDFRDRSEFVLVHGGQRGAWRPLAVTRLVGHDPALGLRSTPTGRDYHFTHGLERRGRSLLDPAWEAALDRRTTGTVELATQARNTRAPRASVVALWLGWYDRLVADGVSHLVMAIVPPLLRAYQTLWGPALQVIGETLEGYVGADSVPAELELRHPAVEAYRQQVGRTFLPAHPDFEVIDDGEALTRFDGGGSAEPFDREPALKGPRHDG